MTVSRRVFTFVALLASFPATTCAQDAPQPFPPAVTPEMRERPSVRPSPLERLSPGQYRIGDILLNKSENVLSFPAVINQDHGLLEYLLVNTHGKTHESLLRTHIEPYDLQLACLLLGMAGSDTPLAYQGDPATPSGDPIEIVLQVRDARGQATNLAADAWVNKGQGESVPLRWVYTGSVIHDGRFAAQVSGSIVALYHDPGALVDNLAPGAESDEIWFAAGAPAVGTPVTVYFRWVKPATPGNR
jgi:hypothetical protein